MRHKGTQWKNQDCSIQRMCFQSYSKYMSKIYVKIQKNNNHSNNNDK